jgi:ribosomal protein S18 acetylase RimI-like enzyme
MSQSEIRELTLEELSEAARVLGRGMRDNPLHVRVFGSDLVRREAALVRLFIPLLQQYQRKGVILGAFGGRRLVGVCAMVAPDCCQPTWQKKVDLLPAIFLGNPASAVIAILRWTSAWAGHDLIEAHWHLGPVGVERDLQGKGIGSALLKAFCDRMDSAGVLAYLETDKSENLRFYERFGFEAVAEDDVIGVRNWFMARPHR